VDGVTASGERRRECVAFFRVDIGERVDHVGERTPKVIDARETLRRGPQFAGHGQPRALRLGERGRSNRWPIVHGIRWTVARAVRPCAGREAFLHHWREAVIE
jgi:hypothetical protein